MNTQDNAALHWLYRDSNRYRLLGLSLVALHFGIAAEVDNVRAILFLVHFGLFLLCAHQTRREGDNKKYACCEGRPDYW